MPGDISLTCNFTLSGVNLSSDDLGVSFESDDGGDNWGGVITIFSPATQAPVVTGLWDSDGDVSFTIYRISTNGSQPATCTIRSGSISGTFEPHIEVSAEAGLQCTITQTGHDTEQNVCDFLLQVTAAAS